MTKGTVYLEDEGVFLQGHRDGADDTEFWGNARISHSLRSRKLKTPGKPVMRHATASKILSWVLLQYFSCSASRFCHISATMHNRCGQDNAQSLFGMTRIPTTPQIRNILDEIATEGLFRVFTWVNQIPLRDTEPALLVNWCELVQYKSFMTRTSPFKVTPKISDSFSVPLRLNK